MVPVRVLGLAVDDGGQPVVLLTPLDGGDEPRVLVPIWIGPQEAASIAVAVSGEPSPRPLAHDLMQRLLAVTGATLDGVAVTRIEDGTFHAELRLATGGGRTVLDCRPSDGIALAARVGAPVFVAEAVLEAAGVPAEPDGEEEQEPEEALAEFRRFLDGVDPEDFQG